MTLSMSASTTLKVRTKRVFKYITILIFFLLFLVDSMLMEVDLLNIALVIETLVELVVCLGWSTFLEISNIWGFINHLSGLRLERRLFKLTDGADVGFIVNLKGINKFSDVIIIIKVSKIKKRCQEPVEKVERVVRRRRLCRIRSAESSISRMKAKSMVKFCGCSEVVVSKLCALTAKSGPAWFEGLWEIACGFTLVILS